MKYNSKTGKEDNLFRYIIKTFFPFWPLFLVLIVVCIAAAWGYLKYTTPVYEASASIMIKDEKKGVDDSKIMESINPFDSKKIVENEIEVLKSRDLMKGVVKNLGLYAPIYEDAGIKTKSAYTSSPIKVIVENPGKIGFADEEPEKHFFEYNIKKEKVIYLGKEYSLNTWLNISGGHSIMFTRNENVNKTAQDPLFFYLLNPKIITAGLIDELDISTSNKLSSVVNLSIKDQVPEKAEDILNQLIWQYNQKIVQDQNELALNTMTFIDERIENVEEDLAELEYKIQEYKSNQGVIDLSEQGRLYLEDVGENDKQISELELQLAVLNNVENYVISKGSAGGMVPSTLGISDPILSQLIEKLYDLEVEYERLKKTTGENNPILISISNQISKIRPSILENVKSQRQNLESRLSSLNSNNIRFNSTLRNIPGKERTLLEINRRKTIKNNLFSYLLQKREEAALANVPTNENSAMIDKAEASIKPVSPKPLFAYLIAMFLAVGAGSGYVVGKEILSGKVLYRSDIEDHTKIPVIAELFHAKNSKAKKFTKPKEFVLIEQFRQLGARLGLYRQDIHDKRILVTSGISGEGKSFVSSNLAFSLAQTGRRVALVDMDFRKHHTSELFDVSNSSGIIGYLKGEETYKNIIHPSKVNPNLFVIGTGAKADDYTEILLNGNLASLVDTLSNDFEYVIIDTAPVNILAEVNLIAEFCEKTLLVIRHGYTSKESLKRLDESAGIQALKNVSIVFNGLKNRGMIETDYGYGYDLKHRMASYAKQ
ncbi:GumC family protein [Salegentibacter maritimus]|uniref:non-specific protein-tyrosine kinase n=1 Tax=Salegentibacter maritimus TaxID=2794347 RepID=A0ABS0TBT4_9FLAO|nr:polysaccharide biosynthesis tyrosine autokinase [Salegentibacter maritimus]MBI6118427.1 polysaccharide biosynthesis tyrosine autokinase [Salegentibacter maritimus]